VNRAKLVLTKATTAEIAAIEAGKATVYALARKMKTPTPGPLLVTAVAVQEPRW
jgi:hypothetical protein